MLSRFLFVRESTLTLFVLRVFTDYSDPACALDDFEFFEELAPLPGEKVFVKTVNSCFSNKELCKYLEEKGEETVIIAGLQTNYCIDASIKSAFDRDYGVIVPEGCNSTFDNDYMDGETTYRYYNEDIWERFAYLVPIEEAFEVGE